ncbi:16S rRNA (cytosine(1402)-N(4))-methyltransferase RsmH, partial [Candidatus Bipolaricaulota bacterium]|nr:16S rRNA (cytosine(1402)-N(4))-methyltransferase RsmH [Candidatus Bipolaricaulota bacterium]
GEYPFEELKDLILRYGEEGWADGIAREIVKRRKERRITSTGQLVEVIESALPEGEKRRRKLHPATKTFQALRIEVNDELTNLEEGLETAFGCLRQGGTLVVISYHSLEDRRVKRFFNNKEKDCICPPDLPVCRCDKEKEAEVTADGITPDEEEIEKNPRARSARLRAVKKLVRS